MAERLARLLSMRTSIPIAVIFIGFSLSLISCTKRRMGMPTALPSEDSSISGKRIIEETDAEEDPITYAQNLSVMSGDLSIVLKADPSVRSGAKITSYSIIHEPSSGVLIGTPPVLMYRPDGNFEGTDFFTFQATDAVGKSATEQISVTVLPTWKGISSGGRHTCAFTQGGTLNCWGENTKGQLGTGNMDLVLKAEQRKLVRSELGTGFNVTQIALGEEHSCALSGGGSVKCWGENSKGQLGLGDAVNRGDGPGEMGNVLTALSLGIGVKATKIVSGSAHSCALLTDGSIKCWGQNEFGQLGIGNFYSSSLPALVSLPQGKVVIDLSAGAFHTCAVFNDGTASCWGANQHGQLGAGDKQNRNTGNGLVDLGAGGQIRKVFAGGGHSCALLSNGDLKCWGANYHGQLGLGDTGNRGDTPQTVGNALPVVPLGSSLSVSKVFLGTSHTCTLFDSGQMKCWGLNEKGQLGVGDTLQRKSPDGYATIGENNSFIDVSVSQQSTCVVLKEGVAVCVGS